MYKQVLEYIVGEQPTISNKIIRLSDNASIPFDPANSDYANFLKDLANGVELQDADGQVIDGKAYLAELEGTQSLPTDSTIAAPNVDNDDQQQT